MTDVKKLYLCSRQETQIKCGTFIFDNLKFLFQTSILRVGKNCNLSDLFPRVTYTFRRVGYIHLPRGPKGGLQWQLVAAANRSGVVKGVDGKPDSLSLNPSSTTHYLWRHGESLNPSVPQFSHLWIGHNNNSTYIIGLSCVLSELTYSKHWDSLWCLVSII